LNLVWSALALDDRIEIFHYIASDSVAVAIKVDNAIEEAALRLIDFPESGRMGRVTGVRELVVPASPYLLAYSIHGDVVRVLRVLHAARQWPDDFPH
jgi:addiction module RelE/StbE family toxin